MKHLYIAVILLAAITASSLDVRAQADPRANSGPFGNLRVGLGTYSGDRDADSGTKMWKPQFSDGGYSLGIEAGAILSRAFSLSIGYQFGRYKLLADNPAWASSDNPDFPELGENSSKNRGTVPLLLRWMIIPSSTVSPYLNLGGNMTLGSYLPLSGEKKSQVAFGPSFGIGFDFVVSRHNSIFLEATRHMTFNDFKADAADSSPVAEPYSGSSDIPESNSSWDALDFWGIGLRHSIKPACGPPSITSVQVPARVNIGEPAPLSVMIAEDACQPVDVSWDLGGGEMETGLGASHMFSTPGQRSITVTARNAAGTVSSTANIDVIDPCPIDAEIIAINLSPSDPIINESTTFTADVRGTAPLTYAWDFGDGSTGSGARASHMYTEPGEYTVSLSCSNCGGSDSRSITVVVREFRCDDLTELNSVFFGSNSAKLSDDAMSLLDENLHVLDECPDKLVRLDGYTDRGERNPQQLSSSRAAAVEQYYIENGVSASRISARGLGRDPLAGKGVDGQRNRRVDSIVVDSFE